MNAPDRYRGVAEVARAAGVHKSYVSKILHGKATGNPRLRRAILAAGLPLPPAPGRSRRVRRGRRATVEVR